MNKHLIPVASLALPLVLLASGCGTSVPQEDMNQASPVDSTGEMENVSGPSSANYSDSAQAAQEPDKTGLVQEALRAQSLGEQKIALLVDERLSNARAAYADGRMEDAANQLQLALQLDPTHREVRSLLTDVQVAMGVATKVESGHEPQVILQAKLQSLKAETEAHAERGQRMLADGDYEGAVSSLTLARANIQGIPYNIDWGTLPATVEADLSKALADRELAIANSLRNERMETFASLQRDEEARDAAHQARQNLMMQEAIEAYSLEDFDRTVVLTDEILRMNPLDVRASELRDTAVRTRHELVSETFITDRQERFRLWLEEIEESKVPQTALYTAPDQEYWNRISNLREGYGNFESGAARSEENISIAAEIATTRIPELRLDGVTDLKEVIAQLGNMTEVPFLVHQAAADAVDNEGIEFQLTLGSSITVLNALELITEAAGDEVVYTIDEGTVHITTRENAFGQVVTKPHDIQDLTIQFTDFAGPRIDQIWLPDSEANEEEEGSIYGGPFGEPRTLVNPDEIADTVINTVAPGTWDDNSAEYANGYLIVTHTPAVQQKVDDFLQNLRRYNSSMVSIEARFLTIQKDFMKEIGIDFRGLGGFPDANDLIDLDDVVSGGNDSASAGLDNNGNGFGDTNPSAGLFFDEAGRWSTRARTENMLGDYGTERMSGIGGLTMQFAFLDDAQTSLILRAVEKSNRSQELNSSNIMAQNTQRAFMTVLNQVTYIQDMDVEVAQAASVADPVIGVVSDGIVIDVRPIISHDRKYITLELQPTVATLLRPIPEFTSSLSGLTTPVTLQLPELFIASAKTNAIVPDGGTVVIAGLRKLLNIEQRAEVPFLAKIPILSVLFKTEGEAYENEDIIVLIRAQILDTSEMQDELDSRRN